MVNSLYSDSDLATRSSMVKIITAEVGPKASVSVESPIRVHVGSCALAKKARRRNLAPAEKAHCMHHFGPVSLDLAQRCEARELRSRKLQSSTVLNTPRPPRRMVQRIRLDG
jgi:hypothetical protein